MRDLKHMQVDNLKIENFHYLLKAFALSTEPKFQTSLTDHQLIK